MSETLRECPFCGSECNGEIGWMNDSSGQIGAGKVVVGCVTSGCCVTGPWRDNEKEAIAAWNKRAEDAELTRLRAEIQALEAREVEYLDTTRRLESELQAERDRMRKIEVALWGETNKGDCVPYVVSALTELVDLRAKLSALTTVGDGDPKAWKQVESYAKEYEAEGFSADGRGDNRDLFLWLRREYRRSELARMDLEPLADMSRLVGGDLVDAWKKMEKRAESAEAQVRALSAENAALLKVKREAEITLGQWEHEIEK